MLTIVSLISLRSSLFQMLQERFREFARDTGNIGQERVDTVNHMADELINSGHSDAATIAEWKDGLNEAWADLLELIDTRTQILAASYELHKFYHDAKEIFGRIQDKHKKLPEELGRDQNTVETLQRMHTTFEHDIQALGTQVCGGCRGRQAFSPRRESLGVPHHPRRTASVTSCMCVQTHKHAPFIWENLSPKSSTVATFSNIITGPSS